MTDSCNIALALTQAAAAQPDALAIRCPTGRDRDGRTRYDASLSYAELDRQSSEVARGLLAIGLSRGRRCALMVRPSVELFVCMFALFKAGVVPVLIDPGISKRALRQCLAEAAPEGFVGIALAHWARRLLGWAPGVVHRVVVGRAWGVGGRSLASVRHLGRKRNDPLCTTDADEIAAILFTSGSTGVPKGVVYRHRHFLAQVDLLRAAFAIEPGGIDLPTFPPFALFDPALGLTSVIPPMDPTRPARANPELLIDAIERFGVTQMFGSPALVDRLGRFGETHGTRLPSLRRVLSAGAPVPPAVVARMQAMLPEDAQIWTPYGATECLPVAVIEGHELAATRAATEAGAGTCVGRPVAPNLVRIIAISDAPIARWSDARELPPGEVGEITVAGPSVTDSYWARPKANALAKIHESLSGLVDEGEQRVVHRMGDLGWLDEQGRLWFCGRKSHRVETSTGALFTEQVEPIFNTHPGVLRTALVGVGKQGAARPVLCVELLRRRRGAALRVLLGELKALGQAHEHTRGIAHFLIHPGFPVDIRHNAKIGREALALWATRKLGR
jgi:acyl-CoA synthetase (AMP-forming)/AMP-acid ligase II